MFKKITIIFILGSTLFIASCGGASVSTSSADDKCLQLPGMPLPASCSSS